MEEEVAEHMDKHAAFHLGIPSGPCVIKGLGMSSHVCATGHNI